MYISIELPATGVAVLRMDRFEARNALDLAMRIELAEKVAALDADSAIRAIVVTGGDTIFAAGADLNELRKRTVHDRSFRDSRVAWTALEACSKPLLAAVNGFALGGGCELALHCDIIVAGEGAKFGLPEIKLGIMPGAGGTQRLLRAVGRARALRYLLTGDMITARQAADMGLISEVVADADTIAHTVDLATRIAAMPPLSVTSIKEVIALGAEASLPSALALERKAFQLLFACNDREEGIAAFVEKRKPVFRGA